MVKTGAHGRPFQLRDRVFLEKQPDEDEKGFKKRSDKAQAIEKPFFDQTLAPGTAVIMTLEANLLTQHGVPAVARAGSLFPAKAVLSRRSAVFFLRFCLSVGPSSAASLIHSTRPFPAGG